MTKRFRLRFTFWLDMLKEGEAVLAEMIEQLKQERRFVETVRDGIKLIISLRQGSLDVLFELFPWVKAEFLEYMRELQPAEPEPAPAEISTADQVWLEAEAERLEAEREWHEKQLEAAKHALEQERLQLQAERAENQQRMQAQLDRVEAMLIAQGNQPIDSPPVTNIPNRGIKPLAGAFKPLAPPQYDDEDDVLLEVKPATKPTGGKTAAENFVQSMFALQERTTDPESSGRHNRRMKGLSHE